MLAHAPRLDRGHARPCPRTRLRQPGLPGRLRPRRLGVPARDILRSWPTTACCR
ncbi:hypothetical protein ACU686_21330 [Yinghuangia aomiensis]